MGLSHATTFPILAQPTTFTCVLSRILPGLSFAMIYASLLIKTNRIARILAGSKKRFPTKNLRFMSATSQVVFFFVIAQLFSILKCFCGPSVDPLPYAMNTRLEN